MAITGKKISALAGVSPSTVSLVYRGSKSIPAATREKVLRIGRAHGYRPNADARSMRQGRFNRIACVVTRFGRKDMASLGSTAATGYLDTITDELARRGYSTIFEPLCLDPTTKDFIDPPKLFSEIAVDGILAINGTGIIPPQVEGDASPIDVPMIWLNRVPTENQAYIYTDDFLNARKLTQHLLLLGHKLIAYYGPARKEHDSNIQRPRGVAEELENAGISTDLISTDSGEGWISQFEQLLTKPSRPTAVVCYNRIFYDLALAAASRQGIRVPFDLSLCYFASEWELYPENPASVLALPETNMAQAAVHMLLNSIQNREIPTSCEGFVGEVRPGHTTCALQNS